MLVIGLAGFSVTVSACSLASPKTIETPYAASDGTNADLPVGNGGTVQFRDFLLVSAAKGSPGVLIGAVSTNGAGPVQLQVSVVDAAGTAELGQATVTARPGQLTRIGPDGDVTVQVSSVPLSPGSTLTARVQAASGQKDFALPVLAPVAQYSTISASPSATSPASETPAASPPAPAAPTTAARASSRAKTPTSSPSAS
jgi:hypothetical protein